MSERKLYIGSKLIKASLMYRNEFLEHDGKDTRVDPDEPGYCVEYPDGYVSWSPKEAFEIAYREVTKAERYLF